MQHSIHLYQFLISPLLGQRCRFFPSCSDYALSCLDNYRLPVAIRKIIRRLTSCHPWHKGGIDLP